MEYDPFSSTFIHSDQMFSTTGNNGQYEIINLQGDVVKTITPPSNPTTAFQIALGDDNLFYINLGTSISILEPATGQQTAVAGAANLLASPTDMARPIRGCFDNTILQ